MNLLETRICQLAVLYIYQSYNTITVDQAFCMASGEAEIEFNTDINIVLSDEYKQEIENQLSIKNK
jgi:hypothetical protein